MIRCDVIQVRIIVIFRFFRPQQDFRGSMLSQTRWRGLKRWNEAFPCFPRAMLFFVMYIRYIIFVCLDPIPGL